jgi:hypothetical protein
MTMPMLLPLTGAVAMLLAAHLVRALRHAMLFPERIRPSTFHLMVGLSIAYVLNALIPFRAGEAARAFYISMRAEQRLGRVAATVIAERLSDVVFVVIVMIGIPLVAIRYGEAALGHAAFLAAGAAVLLAAAAALRSSARVRRLCWAGASIFNDRILHLLADFFWSTARLVTSSTLLRGRYLLLTGLMWSSYFASYALLSRAIGLDLATVGMVLLGSPLSALATGAVGLAAILVLFTSTTAILVLLYGLAVDRSGILRSFRAAARFGLPSGSRDEVLGDAFVNGEDYRSVLRAHFTASEPTAAEFGLHGIDGAIVHRILPGGSDALTAVVECEGGLRIRKFATGAPAAKLAEQAAWLKANRDSLPLPPLIGEHQGEAKYRYDMPFVASARDFYEVIHTAPAETARGHLSRVVDAMAAYHDAHRRGPAPEEAIARYVAEKVVANARAALDFARLRLPEDYTINGEPFALAEWERLTDPAWAAAQIRSRDTTRIHGDLTIENVIICPDTPGGWYLIDPNNGNIFDTELIDWAKLMQSLHLGYEALNRGAAAARLRDGGIDVLFSRSRAYADLHAHFTGLLEERFGEAALREIAFHEIVNYLRLIPYKIRRSPSNALTFFAGASLLIREYEARG